MAAISNLSDYINRATGGSSGTPEIVSFFRDGRAGATAGATVAGRWTSYHFFNGNPSGLVTTPTTAAALTNTSTGTLQQTDPGGGRTKWLTAISVTASAPGVFLLYDRLAHSGGLSGTTTTAQTTNLPTGTLTRYTNGAGNQVWLEIHTAIGSSATTVSVDYKDQAGNTSTSELSAIGGTGLSEIWRMIPMTLASGDTGVTTIENMDLTATTSTAGSIGTVLMHPLVYIPISIAGIGEYRNLMSGFGPIEIPTDSALSIAWLASSTTAPQIYGHLHFVEA